MCEASVDRVGDLSFDTAECFDLVSVEPPWPNSAPGFNPNESIGAQLRDEGGYAEVHQHQHQRDDDNDDNDGSGDDNNGCLRHDNGRVRHL